MAMVTSGGPVVWLCSTAPLEPSDLQTQLAHFRLAAEMQLEGESSMVDWAEAQITALCSRPLAPPLAVRAAVHRDRPLWLCDETRAVLRVTSLSPGDTAATDSRWEDAQVLVRDAMPYLRATTLGLRHSSSLLCPDSGVYVEPYFLDCLDREIERARRHLGELSLAVLELRPTDVRAEPGALVHRRIGGHLRGAVRRTDIVGRVGPRSYGIFFYNTGPRTALIAAGRIADALTGDHHLNSELTFALGVSGWEVTGPDAESVLGQARAAASEALLIAPGRAFVYV
jgi:GGDEF domain-containing protein